MKKDHSNNKFIMQQSEYATQAYVNDGLNQQQGLDSLEGSAALLQANKPEVDGTDIQKARILANVHVKQPAEQLLLPENLKKPTSRHTKTAGNKNQQITYER